MLDERGARSASERMVSDGGRERAADERGASAERREWTESGLAGVDGGRDVQKSIMTQLAFALFCAVFGAVYEVFSHEVYSYFMIYAFAIPLVLGVLMPLAALVRQRKVDAPGRGLDAAGQRLLSPQRFGAAAASETGGFFGTAALRLWNYGAVTLTVGCLMRGALDIYGTTNRLLWGYLAASAVLFAAAIARQRWARRAS